MGRAKKDQVVWQRESEQDSRRKSRCLLLTAASGSEAFYLPGDKGGWPLGGVGGVACVGSLGLRGGTCGSCRGGEGWSRRCLNRRSGQLAGHQRLRAWLSLSCSKALAPWLGWRVGQ